MQSQRKQLGVQILFAASAPRDSKSSASPHWAIQILQNFLFFFLPSSVDDLFSSFGVKRSFVPLPGRILLSGFCSHLFLCVLNFLKNFKKFILGGQTTWRVGSYFPQQGLNPGPWLWKCRVLTSGPPENSQETDLVSYLTFLVDTRRGEDTFLFRSSVRAFRVGDNFVFGCSARFVGC